MGRIKRRRVARDDADDAYRIKRERPPNLGETDMDIRRLALLPVIAAVVLIGSFYLSWASASFALSGSSISESWISYLTSTGSDWTSNGQSLLITIGAAVALVFAVLALIWSRAALLLVVSLAGFVAAAAGSVWLLVQFTQTVGAGANPDLGLWVFLAASVIGGLSVLYVGASSMSASNRSSNYRATA